MRLLALHSVVACERVAIGWTRHGAHFHAYQWLAVLEQHLTAYDCNLATKKR